MSMNVIIQLVIIRLSPVRTTFAVRVRTGQNQRFQVPKPSKSHFKNHFWISQLESRE